MCSRLEPGVVHRLRLASPPERQSVNFPCHPFLKAGSPTSWSPSTSANSRFDAVAGVTARFGVGFAAQYWLIGRGERAVQEGQRERGVEGWTVELQT